MKRHPYDGRPPYTNWRIACQGAAPDAFDPCPTPRFRIVRTDRIVTAGSCFAQHIGRHLRNHDYGFVDAEPAHPIVHPEIAGRYGYGIYSARYGNVYTPRQLVQLLDRAYGRFVPDEDVWPAEGGRLIDPFRPQIQPLGFDSRDDYDRDRAHHFAAVRSAYESADVVVFTLGLTEAWRSRIDGAVYPLCPGVAGGVFDPARHEYVNFEVEDIVADTQEFLARLAAINPTARVLLTVSPVPLMATYEDRHVAVSTTYSKSVLRVACDKLVRANAHVDYFPSYEIITASPTRGRYWAPDGRSVIEPGVRHVMRVFFTRYGEGDVPPELAVGGGKGQPKKKPKGDATLNRAARLVEVLCDEEALGGRD